MLKGHGFKIFRVKTLLRHHELKLLTRSHHELGALLWAHANPVNAGWYRLGPVGLDGHFKADLMKGSNKLGIELQKRLAACANDERLAVEFGAVAPGAKGCVSQLFCGGKGAAAIAIGANKVGVTPHRAAAGAF